MFSVLISALVAYGMEVGDACDEGAANFSVTRKKEKKKRKRWSTMIGVPVLEISSIYETHLLTKGWQPRCCTSAVDRKGLRKL